MQTHHLTIAGHRITVRSAASASYVSGLARELDARIRSVGEHAGPVGAVLVAALGLTDDLTRSRGALEALQAGISAQADAILTEVEAALDDAP